MTLEEQLFLRQLENPAQQRVTAMEQQLAARQQARHLNIGALGAILAYNQQMNAAIQQAVASQPEPPQPNAQPRRVTVQDIFDYHAEKDKTATPFRSVVDTVT